MKYNFPQFIAAIDSVDPWTFDNPDPEHTKKWETVYREFLLQFPEHRVIDGVHDPGICRLFRRDILINPITPNDIQPSPYH